MHGQRECAPALLGRAVAVETERERGRQALRERRDRALVLLDVDGEDHQPVLRVPARESVHERELVQARGAVRAHEVDPDGLATEVREIDRAAADLRHHECWGHLTDMEQTSGRGATRLERARGRCHAGAGGGRRRDDGRGRGRDPDRAGRHRGRRGRGPGLGGEGDDPPEHQQRDGDAGEKAGDDRQAGPHTRAEGTSTDGRQRVRDAEATLRLS